MTLELVQGSQEWREARCGSLGASQLVEALARTKSGWGAGRANVMAQLIAERLTKCPTESYRSPAMQHGTDTEPEARTAYEFFRDVDVVQVGLVPHPTIPGTHASPDGLVGEDGLLELKCPQTATHIETLISGKVPAKYETQILWQLACTGRAWGDFASYDPRMPPEMRLFVRRVPRDEARIAELEGEVRAFLGELDAKLLALRAVAEQREAA